MPNELQPSPLHDKISKILGAVGGIPKNGHNAHFNYDYVQESDVLDAIRPQLAEACVAVYVSIDTVTTVANISTTRAGATQHLTTVQGMITFVDGTSGEEYSFSIAGQGEDGGDKGLPKAITMAVKYGLMKTFLLGTGDDSERVDEGPTQATTPSRPAPPAAAESTPDATRTPQEGAAESPYPWDEGYTPEAAKTAAAPKVQTGKEISERQGRLVYARAKNANLSDTERDEIILKQTGQNRIDGIQWDQMDDILEAFAAFGAHKATA